MQKLSSSNSIDSDSEHSGTDDGSDTGRLHTKLFNLDFFVVVLLYSGFQLSVNTVKVSIGVKNLLCTIA